MCAAVNGVDEHDRSMMRPIFVPLLNAQPTDPFPICHPFPMSSCLAVYKFLSLHSSNESEKGLSANTLILSLVFLGLVDMIVANSALSFLIYFFFSVSVFVSVFVSVSVSKQKIELDDL